MADKSDKPDKIVLAYSGGLDTSVAVRWLKEEYGSDIVTFTVDLGMVDLDPVREKALQIGAVEALVADAKDEFYREYICPALRAGAIYEEQYPLATALGRPLIARHLVKAARQVGATAVAHGCTGKGNDQVRLDVGVAALAPDLRVIAPIRDWGMSREEEIEYARQRDIPVPTGKSPYSTDENLWAAASKRVTWKTPGLSPQRRPTNGQSPSPRHPTNLPTW